MISWWIYDLGSILVFGIASILVYIFAHNPEFNGKIRPLPLGLAVVFSSGFFVGLYMFIVCAIFLMGYGVIELWKRRGLFGEKQ